MQLYAVRIFVHRWSEACAFYRDVLQLKERFRNDEMGWAEYDIGSACFGLERVRPGEVDADKLVGRFVGVSLRVENIEQTYAALRARGVEFRSPPEKQFWGGSLAHLKDPDANVLTLLG